MLVTTATCFTSRKTEIVQIAYLFFFFFAFTLPMISIRRLVRSRGSKQFAKRNDILCLLLRLFAGSMRFFDEITDLLIENG